MATITSPVTPLLSEDLLQRCWERAPGYDAENRFFQEDYDELKQAGYLKMNIPKELGGFGYNMAQAMAATRRLAYYAAPTALGLNMHNYWIGIAADLWRMGDKSLEWMLEGAANGEVFAAGHAEGGNDLPVLLSTASAKRVEGGYKITGRKSFGSLSPVWTFLGVHAQDNSDPSAPKIVHAFIPRNTPGLQIVENWDVLGMRATQSHDTVLDGAFVPDKYVARVVPAGAGGIDIFVLALFMWAVLGFGNVYYGLAQRVFDMTIENIPKRKSLGLSRSMAYHAGIQNGVAEMAIEMQGIGPHLDRVAQDWSDGIDIGPSYAVRCVSAKYHAVEGSWKVVDTAFEMSGGFGIFKKSGLERLWRDARLGRFHPSNSLLTKELVAKLTLGIDPDETPRWG